MRHFLIAVFLVVACATGAAADSFEDAVSALGRGNFTLAARLFRPLAEQGNARAQVSLGRMYHGGHGVTQDYQEALKWFRKAAEQGNAQAQSMLGGMYANGQGVPQDFIRAHMWYNVTATASSGDDKKKAMEHRDRMASQLTVAQIGKAQEMAQRCQQSKFRECD